MDIFPWVFIFFPELLVHGFAQVVFLLCPVLDSSLYIFVTFHAVFMGQISNFEREDASLCWPMGDKKTTTYLLFLFITSPCSLKT